MLFKLWLIIQLGLAQILSPILGSQHHGSAPSALIAHTCQGLGVNGGTTSPIDTTGADFIFIGTSGFQAPPNTDITDNKSNGNPTLLAPSTGGATNSVIQSGYWTNPTTGTGHTFTISTSTVYVNVCVEAWSNMATSSVYDTGTYQQANGAPGCQAGSTTPSAGTKVLIGIAGSSASAMGTWSNDILNVDDSLLGNSTTYYSQGIGSARIAGGSPTNPNWTLPAIPGTGPCQIAAFNGN